MKMLNWILLALATAVTAFVGFFSADSATPTTIGLVVTTPSTVQFDRIPIHYILGATTPTTFNVNVSYSTYGTAGPFAPATEALGSTSEGTSGLPASASGTPHVFVWNSFYDLEMRSNIKAAANVVVRITASNPNSNTSVMRMTNPFSVDNRVFTSIAGTPRTTPLGDGGPALAASLNDVDEITVGQDGTLYFDETSAGFYRAFKVGGTINRIAVNGDLGKGPLQTGRATQAALGLTLGVAIDNPQASFSSLPSPEAFSPPSTSRAASSSP